MLERRNKLDLYRVRNELNSGKSIFDLPLRVTFYARVSTGTDGQTHSLKNQIDYYSDFKNGTSNWTYVDGYIDEALSGTSVTKREAFLRMIEDAKRGKFDFMPDSELRLTIMSSIAQNEVRKISERVKFGFKRAIDSGKIICSEHNAPYYRANYRYKSVNKEVWQCREYSAKGKAGCVSPTIYTTELDEIVRDAYNVIVSLVN